MTHPRATADRTLHFACAGMPATLELGSVHVSEVGDTYRDTPATQLSAISAAVESGTPWREAVKASYGESNPWLHRIVTDPSRDLFFRNNPPAPDSRILDIGAGWGQIALPLARSGLVCALEPTPERLRFIRAAADQEGLTGRMWFLQADFFNVDFEVRFDLVVCIGVLEWVGKFAPDLHPIEAQRQFLSRIRTVLAPGGKLVIGIENRIGLKYLMGAPDDHIGHPGIAVLDFGLADARWREFSGEPLRAATHTRAELEALLGDAGFNQWHFMAAFPDYKLPEQIVPLGRETEVFLDTHFVPEHDGTRGDPVPFQAELRSHYRSMAGLGVASAFVPSFYVMCSVGEEASAEPRGGGEG